MTSGTITISTRVVTARMNRGMRAPRSLIRVGRMLLPLAQAFPQHHFCGYEWSWTLWRISAWRGQGLDNLRFIKQNFMQADLSDVDLVMCFLSNELSQDLSNKFKHELKQGSIIISSAFAIKELTPLKEISAPTYGFLPLKVYVYHI